MSDEDVHEPFTSHDAVYTPREFGSDLSPIDTVTLHLLLESFRVRILLVNDDGIHAPGLRAMKEALLEWGHVDVVAPLAEQSGVGHAVTYRSPLQVHEWFENDEFYGWQVDGTPADCVKLGVMELCEKRPDIVISGVNAGANVGLNVFYSGTAAGCFEGAMFGIPSFATSVFLNQGVTPDFPAISRRCLDVIAKLREAAPQHMAWNINHPAVEGEPAGIELTPMQFRREQENVEPRTDPRGRPYYWVGIHPLKNHPTTPGYDVGELALDKLTVTPMTLDVTCHTTLQSLRSQSLFER